MTRRDPNKHMQLYKLLQKLDMVYIMPNVYYRDLFLSRDDYEQTDAYAAAYDHFDDSHSGGYASHDDGYTTVSEEDVDEFGLDVEDEKLGVDIEESDPEYHPFDLQGYLTHDDGYTTVSEDEGNEFGVDEGEGVLDAGGE